MEKKVQIFLEEHHMIKKGDHLIAGVSGGADSVCLLLVLKQLADRMGFSLTAVHVEHGIRGEESLKDAGFVKELCERERIPLVIRSVDAVREAAGSGQSLEEAARRLRYGCFCDAAGELGASVIAVAHQGDDCAETMLFHLSRGTGLRGLCGIAPLRKISPAAFGSAAGGELTLIRPLMCATRGEVEAYLTGRGQSYCTDSTNGDTAYARNRIRQNVLPELSRINDRTVEHMVRTAGYLSEVSAYLEETAWQEGRRGTVFSYENGRAVQIRIREEHFCGMHPVLQNIFLHRVLGMAAGSRKDITDGHVRDLGALFGSRTGRSLSLPYGLRAAKEYDEVVISPAETGENRGEQAGLKLCVPGRTVLPDGRQIHAEITGFDKKTQKIPQKTYTKWFDYDKIKSTVLLRNRKAGDFLQVDAAGGHKKLKDYFIDEKVPRKERDQVWLLADGNHVMWAVGYRISEAYKVTQETKRVLTVCVDGGIQNE